MSREHCEGGGTGRTAKPQNRGFLLFEGKERRREAEEKSQELLKVVVVSKAHAP
jgi:hypothetical protein